MINSQAVWQDFLSIVTQEVGSRIVETWFKVLTFSSWNETTKTVFLDAPNSFVSDWVAKHYTELLQLHLGRLLHKDRPTVVIRYLPVSDVKHEALTIVPARPCEQTGMLRTAKKVIPHINPHYRFETFVVGSNNSLAYAAAQAIIQKPGGLYNPLFIYGESGLGKTHLLHAIGNEIQARYPAVIVLYQTADRFVQEFIEAIRFDRVRKFQAKYQAVDVLLVDDLQFISNKEQTQEAFFHIFNHLYEAHKQIVFSSDTFPQHMQGIAERLRSRIAGGLVTDIHAPSMETKIAILKRKAQLSNQIVCDDVFEFIASININNVRELEGALIRVVAFASLSGQPVTGELARKVLEKIRPATRPTIDGSRIAQLLHKHFAVSLTDLRSKNRSKELTQVRHLAMFLMKKFTDYSLRDIGEFLGGRDHSTVMYGLTKINQALDDAEFAARCRSVESEILKGS